MSNKKWAVTEAKARLSDLLDAAVRGEPQIITRRGEDTVVVLSVKAYRAKILGPRETLVDFFARSPYREVEIVAARNRQTGRDVDL